MSGGQVKNRPLMQLLANVCDMPVVLPAEHGTAVVLGAAMLGRFAAEAESKGSSMENMSGELRAGLLWDIMVSGVVA
jgi:ribulose kinase